VLRLKTEREPAPIFEIARSGATLGRGPENTIRLEDLSVSRRHARIAYRQGAFWLSDVGSMGGTWLDGTKLNTARRVAAGQVIDIGVCRLTVEFAGDADDPPGKPPEPDQEFTRSRRAAPPVRRRSS
jgi:predicted component of type VI protein secretion system